jgi:two-component system sensor histidine kinase ChvG
MALLLLAGGFFYLDSYRTRLLDNRVAQSLREVRLIGPTSVTPGRGLHSSENR